MQKRPLRIGFDLDGVLLYNPARIARPIVAFIKKHFLKKRTNTFYIPKSPMAKQMWSVFHLSSLFPTSGHKQLKEFIKKHKIQAYIISARYGFLEEDFKKWVKKLDPDHVFIEYYHNTENKQPHVYKKQMIDKLGLDVFVEDNWDIIRLIKPKTKTKMFWITNILDRNVYHEFKYTGIEQVVKKLREYVEDGEKRS